MTSDLRNIAIIAHVDHGKTTLIDVLLKATGAFREGARIAERVMDSNALERERGITILAKVTSLLWQDARINIVDTPGHADFGGEVERILNMVDGALLLVDASEGPMPQTKFVLTKALAVGLKPIVVINKVDKTDARPDEVLNEVFDLFAALGASDEQLDFPVLYGSAKQGWMADTPDGRHKGIDALLDLVLTHVPAPVVEEAPFRMLATTLEADPFLGRLLTGRIRSGSVKAGQSLRALSREGEPVETFRVSKVLAFRGLERQPIEAGEAGDIVALAGMSEATVADTLADPSLAEPIFAQPIDPPTLAMSFRINDGPLAGREGDKVQSRVIRERLLREAEGNVALKVSEAAEKDAFEVAGRGELQLAILIETMRREGFELTIGKPRVVTQVGETGETLEPVEEVTIDVDDEHSGVVIEKLSTRRGEMAEMRPSGGGRTRLVFHVPTRGLIGYLSELLSDTRGTAIMNRVFHGFMPWRGEIPTRHTGVLISNGTGAAVPYALFNLQERGAMMVGPGDAVYPGMIVGEHSRGNDLEVNVLKGKQLSNVRAAGKDDNVLLTPPMRLSLEQALSYIADDELVEVTPRSIRLRKAILDPHERKRAERAKKDAA
ncbi:translational GTPase TypA [Afifella pfennigii]|uniref:translational GTPase TypA n=1 Tax=Afifella pfennigii TaxID=209897 RepID=UPI00047D5576|nr:translational GTPase TypA [Afifella pfennigii]